MPTVNRVPFEYEPPKPPSRAGRTPEELVQKLIAWAWRMYENHRLVLEELRELRTALEELELEDLENVAGTPTGGEVLTYSAGNQRWEPL